MGRVASAEQKIVKFIHIQKHLYIVTLARSLETGAAEIMGDGMDGQQKFHYGELLDSLLTGFSPNTHS